MPNNMSDTRDMNGGVATAPLALSFVIPVYGSEKVLPELVARLQAVLDTLPAVRGSYEVGRTQYSVWGTFQPNDFISEAVSATAAGVLLRSAA